MLDHLTTSEQMGVYGIWAALGIGGLYLLKIALKTRQAARLQKTYVPSSDSKEVSMEIDLNHLEPLLKTVASKLESGLDSAGIQQVVDKTKVLAVEKEFRISFPVKHRGRPTKLEIHIAMTDIDTPAVYLQSDSVELSSDVRTAVQNFLSSIER